MRQVGWTLVFAVACIQVLAGGALLLGSTQASFEQDTGVGWSVVEAAFPTVTAQFEIVSQSSLAGAFVVGLYAVLVCAFGLRAGQRWAWSAMWLMPAFMLPGIFGLLATDNQQAYGYFGLALVAVAALGLLLSIPGVFRPAATTREGLA